MSVLNIYATIALVNVATSIVLGILIFSADKRAPLNRVFAFFAASIAFWSYAYFNWQTASMAGSALFWTHILMMGALFITPLYFHFSTIFLGIERKYRQVIIAGYAFIAVSLVLNWTPFYITGVHSISGFAFWPEAGTLFLPILAIWVGYAILPIILFFRALGRSSEQRHISALKYMLAGTIIGYLGGCTNYFLWFGIPVLPWGNISASIYLALVAYAIMRYRLFNMKVLATELLIFTLWLFIFVRLILSQGYQDSLINAALLLVTLVVGVLLIRSVDREVEQRELIEQQEKDLKAVNKQQENLLHFISHEIKGYLTKSEAGFAAIAQGDVGPVSAEVDNLANAALIEVRKGVRTVMDILDASNLKKGTMSYKKNVFDLKDVVVRVVDHLKPAADEKHLAIAMNIAWEVPCKINGDEEKIRDHVIRNLIDNAIKYTPAGTIKVEVSRKDATIRFSVQDSGVGITPDDMALLFTEGGHGKDSIKINVHSTGYGLFIAKTIVDNHGGKIWAESKGAGAGSRFVVELPAV
jgi:signal transduction histidine kinase